MEKVLDNEKIKERVKEVSPAKKVVFAAIIVFAIITPLEKGLRSVEQ